MTIDARLIVEVDDALDRLREATMMFRDVRAALRSEAGLNVRHDAVVHAGVGDGRQPLCGTADIPVTAPIRTGDAVTCADCRALDGLP